MTTVVVNEPLWFYQWETDRHVAYDCIVRVIPGTAGDPHHPKLHLTVYSEEAPSDFFNINNIENEEIEAPDGDLSVSDYWRKRYSVWPLA